MKIKKWIALGSISTLPLSSIAMVSCGGDPDHNEHDDHDHEEIDFTDELLKKFPQQVTLPLGTANTDDAKLKASIKKAIEDVVKADTTLIDKDKKAFDHLMEHDYDLSYTTINTTDKKIRIKAHDNRYEVSYTIEAASTS